MPSDTPVHALVMEATLQLLAWVGVVLAASVAAAVAIGILNSVS